jgi:capsid portal protein
VGVLVRQRDEALRASLGLRLFMDTLVRGTCPMSVTVELAEEDRVHSYTESDKRSCVLGAATLQKIFEYLGDGPAKFAMPGDVAEQMMADARVLVPKLTEDRANVQALMTKLAKIQTQLSVKFPDVVWEGRQSTDIAWQLICAGCVQDQDLRDLEAALLKAEEDAPAIEFERVARDDLERSASAEMLERVQAANRRVQEQAE